jgi:lysophospholipase L1-like esterase
MRSLIPIVFFILTLVSCDSEERSLINQNPLPGTTYHYLALGDSYTIGQGVCETCRFPAQLRDTLKKYRPNSDRFELDYIAQTGWTTTQLKFSITNLNPSPKYDLVTLLIGVNNQYQNQTFSIYQTEFPELLQTAITLAKGNKERVIVASIPDYAFTPFGQGRPNPGTISTQIDMYNAFAENHAQSQGVSFVNITDITRQGLVNPALVAGDNLHPSAEAYRLFVERITPVALQKLDW